MKRLAIGLVLVSLTACSKTVSREGSAFFQENPVSDPTDPVPSPNPSPSPSPHPNPSPSPRPTPVGCVPKDLGSLLDVSVFARGDFRSDRVDLGGRVEAGYVCAQHGEFGTSLGQDPSRVDLASAGALGVNRMKISRGRATYGSTLERVGSSALGGFSKASVDLGSDFRKILDFETECGKAPVNAKVSKRCRTASDRSPGECTLTISGRSSGVNVAELTAKELVGVDEYVVDVPSGSSLVSILRETRIGAFHGVRVRFLGSTKRRVFWSFPAGDRLEFVGTEFQGIVIAPDASVTVEGQSGEGGFWVQNLNSTESNW